MQEPEGAEQTLTSALYISAPLAGGNVVLNWRSLYVPSTDVCVSVQALLSAGEPTKASLCLRVLLESSLEAHKQDVLVLLFLVKAGCQIGTLSSLQGALIHARSASGL